MTNQQRRWGFGLYYDLSTTPDFPESSGGLNTDALRQELLKSGPDWICCPAKGPRGVATYPTRIGASPLERGVDSLRAYRDAAAELEIPFWVEYSAWLDAEAVRLRPEWAAAGSEAGSGAVCPQSAYRDERLIPQLLELARDYAVDGIWITGGQTPSPCRCERCADAKMAPTSDGLLEACVEQLQVAGLTCRVASDRAGRSGSVEGVETIYRLPEEYGAERAAMLGAVLTNGSDEWALVISPSLDGGASGAGCYWKTTTHLCQEAAVVAAAGGSILLSSPVDAKARPIAWQQDRLAEVARFWREREPALRDTVPVAQALLLADPQTEDGECGTGSAAEGSLRALRELGWSAQAARPGEVDRAIDEFPLVLLAGKSVEGSGLLVADRNDPAKVTALLDRYSALPAEQRDSFRRAAVDAVRALGSAADRALVSRAWLETYVWFGGCLLLAGANVADTWGDLLGVNPVGAPRETQHFALAGRDCAALGPAWQPVSMRDADPILPLLGGPDPSRDLLPFPAVTRRPLGFGTVIGVYGPLFEQFDRCPHPDLRSLIRDLIRLSGARPLVEADLPPWVEVSARRRPHEWIVHLVNRGCAQALRPQPAVVESVPELRLVSLQVRVREQPQGVRQVPDAPGLVWTWEGGVLTVHLPQVRLHEILVIHLGEV